MSSRKAPRCRSCKHPMKGHNKLGLCMSASPEVLSREEEEAEQQQQQQQQQAQGQAQAQAQDGAAGSSRASAHSYMSPPPTPPPSSAYAATSTDPQAQAANPPIAPAISPLVPTPQAQQQQQQPQRRVHIPRTYTPAILSEPSFVIPETGYFHRRNPNFVHPPPRQVLPDPYSNSHGAYGGGPLRHFGDHNEEDDDDDDDDYNGGPGAQTPTVIVGSDGETVEALSDRSGSASPGPPGDTRSRTPRPRANPYAADSSMFSSSSSFFGAPPARTSKPRYRTEAEERCERRAGQRHSRSPRPPKTQRNGSVIAGGLAYLGSFKWIRSPTPSEASTAYVAAAATTTATGAGVVGASAGARHRSRSLGYRHPHRAQPHHHQAVAAGAGEAKISTRDMMVLGLVVVVGSAVSMMLVMYVGLRSLRSIL